MADKKKEPTILSGNPSLKCGKCGKPMAPSPNNPKVKVCSSCGNRAGTVRLQ